MGPREEEKFCKDISYRLSKYYPLLPFLQGIPKRQWHAAWSRTTSKLRVTGLCVGNSPRRPVNSPHKGPVTRKMFPFDNVIMNYINPGYGLSLVDTLWNASSYRQPLEQEDNPMTWIEQFWLQISLIVAKCHKRSPSSINIKMHSYSLSTQKRMRISVVEFYL